MPRLMHPFWNESVQGHMILKMLRLLALFPVLGLAKMTLALMECVLCVMLLGECKERREGERERE